MAAPARRRCGESSGYRWVAEADRTGGGVPYARYGERFRNGQGAINRPAFTSGPVEEWLPGLRGSTRR